MSTDINFHRVTSIEIKRTDYVVSIVAKTDDHEIELACFPSRDREGLLEVSFVDYASADGDVRTRPVVRRSFNGDNVTPHQDGAVRVLVGFDRVKESGRPIWHPEAVR